MIRHTGGFALSATSTRSRSMDRAIERASGSGRMPICPPSGPTSRTSRARMRSLIRGSLLFAAAAMADHSSRFVFLSDAWIGQPAENAQADAGEADVRDGDTVAGE